MHGATGTKKTQFIGTVENKNKTTHCVESGTVWNNLTFVANVPKRVKKGAMEKIAFLTRLPSVVAFIL